MRGIIPIPRAEGDTTRLFKVPVTMKQGEQATFTCICKLAFRIFDDDDEVLPIQNMGALQLGLEAKQKEDANDFVRSRELWQQGKGLLIEESDNETGPQSEGNIIFDDEFLMSEVGRNW